MFRSCILLACALALPAAAAIPEPSGLARTMRVLPGEEPAFALTADGVQVYQCQQVPGDAAAYAWFLVAPDATLYDGPASVARMASPRHWESLYDLSSVSGIPLRLQSAGAENLPWELMRAVPVGTSGIFAGVSSIQRVNTRGGAPPRDGCDATHLGDEARVAFSADYYFYKPRAAG
jgi:hypothetical protein